LGTGTKAASPLFSARQALLLTGGLAAATVLVIWPLSPPHRRELIALVLVAGGAIYVGTAIARADRRPAAIEGGALVATGALAIGGLWVSAYLLPVGLLLHAGWDLWHLTSEHQLGSASIPAWYACGCASYDGIIAAVLLLLMR
jgi:hypothetical protein